MFRPTLAILREAVNKGNSGFLLKMAVMDLKYMCVSKTHVYLHA